MIVVAKTMLNATALHKAVRSLPLDETLPDTHQYLSIIFPAAQAFIEELMYHGFGHVDIFHGKILLTINKRDLELLRDAIDDEEMKSILERIV